MIVCNSCGNQCNEGSRFCNECGAALAAKESSSTESSAPPVSVPNFTDAPPLSSTTGSQVTSVGIPAVVQVAAENGAAGDSEILDIARERPARLIIERGDGVNTEFALTDGESNIGRWDADNGIFPDVDLDAYDPDAKVSRRHARIVKRESGYFVEDLGSTNGTFVNRGRRLLPGSPQSLKDGDEIIVGKTFLRFKTI